MNAALFRRMRSAITAISDVRFPFPGAIDFLEGHGEEISLHLSVDANDQAAEALLAWFYRLTDAQLTHHRGERGGASVFVTVRGSYFAVPTRFRVTAAFHDPAHAAVLCPEDHDHGATYRTVPLSVHRLRRLQMLQRSGWLREARRAGLRRPVRGDGRGGPASRGGDRLMAIEENAVSAAVSVPFGVGMATAETVATIEAAKSEALAIVRGEQPLTEGAVRRAAAALAAEDRLIGGGHG